MEISSIRSQPAELDASYTGSDNQNTIRAAYNQDRSEDVSLSISAKKRTIILYMTEPAGSVLTGQRKKAQEMHLILRRPLREHL